MTILLESEPESLTRVRAQFKECLDVLSNGKDHRVWSLIVTFFGDLAQSEGDRVSGSLLTRFGRLAGVKPEAMRVALHRLRRDGWIDSERNGRKSSYFLTPWGRDESASASPRIYSNEGGMAEAWTLIVGESGARVEDLNIESADKSGNFVPVDERIAIAKQPDPHIDVGVLQIPLSETILPVWIKRRIIDAELIATCDYLFVSLERLDHRRPEAANLSPIEIATLRTLIVHSWRRVRLRQPDLPDGCFPDEWKGAACRRIVCDLLSQLPKPALDVLEDRPSDTCQEG